MACVEAARVTVSGGGGRKEDRRSAVRPVLSNLVVAEGARRKGVAERLVGEAEVTAMSWGFDSCYLLVCADNAPAVSLYKKLGFTVAFEDDEAKTSEVEQDGTVKSVPAAVLVMRKSLT
jgi:ribosomal protein S18 acetylase RimI-like enzyme